MSKLIKYYRFYLKLETQIKCILNDLWQKLCKVKPILVENFCLKYLLFILL